MKRKISMMLALCMIASTVLVGCGETSEPSNNDEIGNETVNETVDETVETGATQEITYALQNQYDNIDPTVTSNSFASVFLTNLFEGLVTYDENSQLMAGIAESWDISEDGLVYTFTLRDGLKWSDDSDFSSADLMYTFERIITPETASQYVSMATGYIKNAQAFYDGEVSIEEVGISAPDANTFVIELADAAPFFIDILTMAVFSPVQEAAVEANPDSWTLSADTYVSNGPFKIESINFGESVVLVKNENYHAADTVNLEKINFRYILEASTALSAYESGEIDGLQTIPPADMPRLKTADNGLQIIPSYSTTYYLVNCENETLSDANVRKALALALDRTALIENVLQTTDTPASGLVSPGYTVNGEDFVDGRDNFGIEATANIEEAQRLLAEAGYENGEGFPTLRLGYYSDSVVKKVAEAMQQMWKDNLNIDLEITVADWAVYYSDVQAGDYDIAAMGWGADYLNPMTFLPLLQTGESYNNSFYSNPAYDELVIKAKTITDPYEAMLVMREAEVLLMEDMPIIPLYHRSSSIMMNPDVTGYNVTPLDRLFFRTAKVNN